MDQDGWLSTVFRNKEVITTKSDKARRFCGKKETHHKLEVKVCKPGKTEDDYEYYRMCCKEEERNIKV